MLEEAYAMGELDALEYAMKVAEETKKPGMFKRMGDAVRNKKQELAGKHPGIAKHLSANAKKYKYGGGAAGAAAVAGGGYAAYKSSKGGKKRR